MGCLGDLHGRTTMSSEINCTAELQAQLRSIFIVAILKNFAEFGIPYVKSLLKKWKHQKLYAIDENDPDSTKLMVWIEKQMQMDDYAFKEIDGTYYDYLEIML